MTAKYIVYGINNSDTLTEITIMLPEDSDTDTEISVRVQEENTREIEIDIKYRGNSDVYTEIQPVGHNNVPAEIYIRPHNRMWGLYEVQEPPKITDIFNPVQDSFTRSKSQYQSINYGGNNSLPIGRTDDDIYRSFIQFSFANWNPSYVIIESKLRLYYSGLIPQGAKIELFTVNKQWQEYGITDLNRPSPTSLIVDEYTNNSTKMYVEFEFTDVIVDWIKQNVSNYGFMIRLANESVDSIVTFRARESTRPPELLITYYDARIYSTGRSQVPVEIFVWNTGNSDTLTEIEVGSVIDNSDVLTEIYVHRREVPVESEYETEITVTKPYIYTEVTVSINDESDVFTELVVRSETMHDRRDIEIIISKPAVDAELYVKHQNSTHAEITVQRNEDSDKPTEIAVSRESADVELYVKYANSIESEITVQRVPDDDKETEIAVTRETVDAEIYVKHKNDTATEITVQRDGSSSIDVEIAVSRPDVWTEIMPRVFDESDRDAEIYVRAINDSSKLTEIAVTRDAVLVEITVVESSDIETEIYVKHTDDVLTEITITVFDDILTEIDVIHTSKMPVEISVSRPDTLTEIMVPYWDDSDTLTEIQPRILRVSDAETTITVRAKGGSYVFII